MRTVGPMYSRPPVILIVLGVAMIHPGGILHMTFRLIRQWGLGSRLSGRLGSANERAVTVPLGVIRQHTTSDDFQSWDSR